MTQDEKELAEVLMTQAQDRLNRAAELGHVAAKHALDFLSKAAAHAEEDKTPVVEEPKEAKKKK